MASSSIFFRAGIVNLAQAVHNILMKRLKGLDWSEADLKARGEFYDVIRGQKVALIRSMAASYHQFKGVMLGK
jgi:hypothetical protein